MPWSAEEDDALRAIVRARGAKKWNDIARAIGTKCSKQCRRRWRNHLTNVIKEHEWTREEDETLLATHARIGNKWTEIARVVGGRTDNATKNRYAALIAKSGASAVKRRAGAITGALGGATKTNDVVTTPKAGRGKKKARIGTKSPPATPTSAKKRVRRKTTTPNGGIKSENDSDADDALEQRLSGERPSTLREALRASTERTTSAISPTLFTVPQSPSTSSLGNGGISESAGGAWRPSLSINVPKRGGGSVGGGGGAFGATSLMSMGASEAFLQGVSLGRSLSLSCAELDILREVQDMISPHAMAGSQGGTIGSAFVRYGNKSGGGGAPPQSQTTGDAQHIMNWLLSAAPAGEPSEAPTSSQAKRSNRGSSKAGDVSVNLPPAADGNAAANIERGATLKHFLSLKAAAASGNTPRGMVTANSIVPGSPGAMSVPSFTSSELNMLLNALGAAPPPTSPRSAPQRPPPSNLGVRARGIPTATMTSTSIATAAAPTTATASTKTRRSVRAARRAKTSPSS
uniref:Uncharacterized protein n=1 Tax=Ostreococcus mediterraneus TaxID=1486918 RepID=A0A7S0Z5Q3_9CHLO|mmetsp:Transcript_4902/g.10715  ORF Transcript_4902/g.10715 Transcript_4902/m.10715 type:complete len:518 (+) Transcript_4902:229-1782(+)